MNHIQTLKELQDRIELFRKASGGFERECARTILDRMPRVAVAVYGTVIEREDLARFFEVKGFSFDKQSITDITLLDILALLTPDPLERHPLYREIVDLHGEALFGLTDVSDAIYDYHYKKLPSSWDVYFEEEIPREWYAGTELEAVMEARRCRRVIDGEEGYEGQTVSVDGLAALASINVKTLRNILSREGSGIHLIKSGPNKGCIEAHVAREWLKTRPEYLPTIPLSVSTALNEGLLQLVTSENGPFLFVPAAADGTTFSPSSTVNGKYEIGSKGRDLSFADYHEALLALQNMAEPTWKRLDKANRVRVTTTTHWLRIPENSLRKGA